ncbi:mannose-P-dolichol utilization defect 1 protein [Metschnikowia bicuspidata var. bicuspidata NRRL YB-4993]|uniref:Solute carrier family 66 member 3 n=1 Tax=Metschnikowia bicuspidata var. bicuspidata NRRL YB-4993 TaxID=869754 RepID=A0A1A0HHF7_9ASCO|nr:mannose-P-dolichol utilization defect 1 protein [Metschnikowia bicuspidata var. bicuspidata NRRL YB-4993]OBA23278.1 mannose-P-dolichol utilization defect 1 protein [Metschnikowia bicuspidata var. bicuspidata NRRL YB-4993]
MSSPVFMMIKLIGGPILSNRVILQLAFRQAKTMGYTRVLVASLGAIIVAVSSFIKVPHIKKLLKPKTALQRAHLVEGVLKQSVQLETLAQFVHVAYNKQQGNSFVNYGESLLLGLQNTVLLLVIEYYQIRKAVYLSSAILDNEQKEKSLRKLVLPMLTITGLIVYITKIAPPGLILALQLANIPISIAAKVPQIRKNTMLRSTTHLSGITVGANVLGSLARVFTTMSNFKRSQFRDFVLLTGYLSSLLLNSVLVVQIWKYRNENFN